MKKWYEEIPDEVWDRYYDSMEKYGEKMTPEEVMSVSRENLCHNDQGRATQGAEEEA